MGRQGIRRFWWGGRRFGVVLLLVVVALLGLWLLVARPWTRYRAPSSLQARLDVGVRALSDYGERIEASLQLQFLQAALVDGRRSSFLRTDYRLLEEQLDPIIARMDSQSGAALEAQLDRLLVDLTRDRSAAHARLEEMRELLLPTAGLERQGDQRQ